MTPEIKTLEQLRDYYEKASDQDEKRELVQKFLNSAIPADISQTINIDSLTSRLVCLFDEINKDFLSNPPFTENKDYINRVNKLNRPKKQKTYKGFNYIDLATAANINLGTFFARRRQISLSLDPVSQNILMSVVSTVFDRAATAEGVANYCFPSYSTLSYRTRKGGAPFSPYQQANEDSLLNLIQTGRFDPWHTNGSNSHDNDFTVYEGTPRAALYNKFFMDYADTPHLHFFTEEVCCGFPLTDNNHGKIYRGNTKSLAINLGQIGSYIKAIYDAMENNPDADILKEENSLGMPYLKIVTDKNFKFDDAAFRKKAKSIFKTKGPLLRLGLQFFATPQKTKPNSDILKFAQAFEFINKHAKKLTPEEQTELLMSISQSCMTVEKEDEFNIDDTQGFTTSGDDKKTDPKTTVQDDNSYKNEEFEL